ncbi:D-alanyl-D-alanine carboxypeptidase family protein [Fundidesulfovibrio terrae]|uniref:D-alanyl-D-alanine carboxypeptidase family protein n=1 Tax=Fundidesulfovibrio terrae TaxID=2922866 RepID=UPI001FAF2BFF|nr:D-alanyl-D-alanine carboxypeptidase family protein [Fundidesulfovibrio terrae]
MRRWTVFAAALIILTMLFQVQPVLAKSGTSEKKSDKQVHSPSKSSSSKSASSSKASKKEEKKHSSKDASKKEPATQEHKSSRKGKKSHGAEALARPAAVPLPDSFKGEFGVDTKAAFAVDMENGKVLFAQEPDAPIPPASLTKVLTLYLLNERLKAGTLRLDEVVTVSQEASHAGGSTMRLKTGESVTVEELIKGIAVASANDGCMAIAQYLGNGDYHPFVEEMNRKAKELGMTNSQFFNPNGLPAEGQVTTARDMATLAQAYLTKFPETLSIHSMTEFTHNNRVRHNSNSLLGKVEGVDGLKTGFVCAAGFNIVVTARRGDTRLVAVVLGAKNRRVREREATRLVEEGFKIVAAEKGQSGKHVAMIH